MQSRLFQQSGILNFWSYGAWIPWVASENLKKGGWTELQNSTNHYWWPSTNELNNKVNSGSKIKSLFWTDISVKSGTTIEQTNGDFRTSTQDQDNTIEYKINRLVYYTYPECSCKPTEREIEILQPICTINNYLAQRLRKWLGDQFL